MTNYSYRAARPPRSRTKVGRNQRCQCQSDRNFKQCHGR
ncbi:MULTISPECIES: SEC-C metal-binding domain-containing protein [Phyllobacteriaceae]